MWKDPIVEEVRRFRDKHAAAFRYDLRKIYDDLRNREKQGNQRFVSLPPKRPASVHPGK